MSRSGPAPAAPGAERSADIARRALQRLTLSGALRTVDAAFADLLRRLGAGPEVALAGALAMRAVAQGDSGFALIRAEALLAALDASATLPDPEAWREALRASRWVALSVAPAPAARAFRDEGDVLRGADVADAPTLPPRPAAGSSPALLVFEHDRVALLRYARFEHDLACRLLERHGGSATSPSAPAPSGTPTVHAAASGTVASSSSSGTPTFLSADETVRYGESGGGGESGTPTDLGKSGTPADLTPLCDTHPSTLARLRRLFALHEADAAPAAGAQAPALDRQALAAWVALRRRLLLLTGGPGTGKTTTVARLLALAVEDARAHGLPPPRIALAAPTGRAAARLAEAVGAQLARDLADDRLDAALAAAVPRQASTLHRLLGAQPGVPGFRHHARRPLPFDLVVVDEASMIDLPLMDRLVAAVAPEARLVLIGDPDQLPAVEAGDVLGALCAAAGDGLAVATVDAQAATLALGVPVPVIPVAPVPVAAAPAGEDPRVPASPLAGARVQLVHGWRQAGAAPLQAFAAAVRAGDADAALALLPVHGGPASEPLASDASGFFAPGIAAPQIAATARERSASGEARLSGSAPDGVAFDEAAFDEAAFDEAAPDPAASAAPAHDAENAQVSPLQRLHGDPAALAAWLRAWALPMFAAVRDAHTAEDALVLAQRLRLLTALRRGPFGADAWNAWCAAELGARGRWFHGALIAVAANSRHHGLYNGDLGVIRRDRDGSLKAWFALQEPGGETRWRGWRPAQLPAHDLAFATTVHKAQGSEFERVALILPDRDSRALGRELLYTAATRARRALWLWAEPERVREAIARPAMRDSGLLARLRAGG